MNRIAMRRLLTKISIYVVLILGAGVVLVPFAWMVSTSLKPFKEIFIYPPEVFPRHVQWRNYVEAIYHAHFPVWVYFRNSLIISAPVAVLDVLMCAIVAFAFARLWFRGRDILFLILLSTMMLPGQVTMIPTFILYSRLGWIDTFLPIIVPAFFGWNYGIFLLRQYFASIPDELDDAARIDGCGPVSTMFRIHMPIAKPALGMVAIFSFTGMWSEFLRPLLYLRDIHLWPMTLALNAYKSPRGGNTRWEYLMVMTIFTCLPPLLLFLAAQRYYIQGVVITGVKG